MKSSTIAVVVGALAVLWTAIGVTVAMAQAPDVGCTFDVAVSQTGKLSAAVYRADGVMVRTLEYLKEVQPGKVPLNWDGLDDFHSNKFVRFL